MLPPSNPALGLALLRLATGIVFLMHGYQKLFAYGISGVTGFFTQMGIPLASVAAPAVALIEFVGGLLVIAGLGHRIASALQVGVMAGAIIFAKGFDGFYAPDGLEFELTLLLAAAAIAIGGGGAFTLEERFAKAKR